MVERLTTSASVIGLSLSRFSKTNFRTADSRFLSGKMEISILLVLAWVLFVSAAPRTVPRSIPVERAVQYQMVDSFISSRSSLRNRRRSCQKYSPMHMTRVQSALSGKFESTAQRALGAAFQLVADGPVVGPNEAFGMLRPRIDQHHSALKIVDQDLVGLLRNIVNQPCKKPLRFIGPAFCLQENERFAQFYMPGAVHVELSDNHKRAKDQQGQEK